MVFQILGIYILVGALVTVLAERLISADEPWRRWWKEILAFFSLTLLWPVILIFLPGMLKRKRRAQ